MVTICWLDSSATSSPAWCGASQSPTAYNPHRPLISDMCDVAVRCVTVRFSGFARTSMPQWRQAALRPKERIAWWPGVVRGALVPNQ